MAVRIMMCVVCGQDMFLACQSDYNNVLSGSQNACCTLVRVCVPLFKTEHLFCTAVIIFALRSSEHICAVRQSEYLWLYGSQNNCAVQKIKYVFYQISFII